MDVWVLGLDAFKDGGESLHVMREVFLSEEEDVVNIDNNIFKIEEDFIHMSLEDF